MKTGLSKALFLSVLAALCVPSVVNAEDVKIAEGSSAEEEAAKPAVFSHEWFENTKHPTSWLSWGADLRMREEYFDCKNHQQKPSDTQSYQRYRFRLWSQISPTDYFSFKIRALSALRVYQDPTEKLESPEVVCDNLYIDFNEPLSQQEESGKPAWRLRVGRQDLQDMNCGWLIYDGTTKDGSRSTYFDSARFTYRLPDDNTTLDAVYFYQTARSDAWLAPINLQQERRDICEQDTQGGMLLVRNTAIDNTTLEGLVVYEHRYRNKYLPSNYRYGDLVTVRPKVVYNFDDHWSLSSEAAGQFGTRQWGDTGERRDVRAWGSLSQLTYSFKDSLKNKAWLGFEYLSGDSGHGGTDSGFDILWGHYIRVSEYMAYSRVDNDRSWEYSNMLTPFVGYSIEPLSRLTFTVNYRPWFTPANPQKYVDKGNITDEGSFRGHLINSKLNYVLNSHLEGHIVFESMLAGNYFAQDHRDTAYFVRAQLFWKW